MNKRTNTARGLSLLLVLLLTLSAFAGCSGGGNSSDSQPSSQTGSAVSAPASSAGGQSSDNASVSVKTVILEVVHKDGSKKEFTMETEAENLRAALEQEKLIEGEESDYGLFVKTVDGETVDDANEEWWKLTDKDGEMTPTGVDDTKIADGDVYVFTFTVGY